MLIHVLSEECSRSEREGKRERERAGEGKRARVTGRTSEREVAEREIL
jgi:hypothetical protein